MVGTAPGDGHFGRRSGGGCEVGPAAGAAIVDVGVVEMHEGSRIGEHRDPRSGNRRAARRVRIGGDDDPLRLRTVRDESAVHDDRPAGTKPDLDPGVDRQRGGGKYGDVTGDDVGAAGEVPGTRLVAGDEGRGAGGSGGEQDRGDCCEGHGDRDGDHGDCGADHGDGRGDRGDGGADRGDRCRNYAGGC